MPARSLKSLLTRHWTAFAVGVTVLFAAAGLLLLFLLEDSFIDRQLHAVARTVSSSSPALSPLPAEFAVYPVSAVPLDIHARLPFAQVGRPFEMRRADRRYVHVLLVDTPSRGRLAIVYDVTEQLTVTPRLGAGLLIVLALAVLTFLAAALLARGFIGRVTRQVTSVADEVQLSPDPAHLRRLAESQQILELQQLLVLHAGIWEAQLASIESERQTLAYLGHELRTPLQSAQTSLALLEEQRDDLAAFNRLQRAVGRLARASSAALWLSTERTLDRSTPTSLIPLIERLAVEFAPLAKQSGQRIELALRSTLAAWGPAEVLEAIVSNLLLNAIQHGAAGTIRIEGSDQSLSIRNPVRAGSHGEGFGFGLEIVRRLGERIGWSITFHETPTAATARLAFPPPDVAAPQL